MKMLDVNVLLNAMREDLPEHELVRSWLQRVLDTGEAVAVTSAVASGAVRVVTNRRVFSEPYSVDQALSYMEQFLALPNVVRLDPGPRNWQIFSSLCLEQRAEGSFVSDVSHAATAIEHGAVWVSFDRDFARFSELRWEMPA